MNPTEYYARLKTIADLISAEMEAVRFEVEESIWNNGAIKPKSNKTRYERLGDFDVSVTERESVKIDARQLLTFLESRDMDPTPFITSEPSFDAKRIKMLCMEAGVPFESVCASGIAKANNAAIEAALASGTIAVEDFVTFGSITTTRAVKVVLDKTSPLMRLFDERTRSELCQSLVLSSTDDLLPTPQLLESGDE
jgi:hypothetical protein